MLDCHQENTDLIFETNYVFRDHEEEMLVGDNRNYE